MEIADGGEIIRPDRKVELNASLVLILIITSVFVFALGIGMAFLIFSHQNQPAIPSPAANISPTLTPVARKPGILSGDAGALKLQGDLKTWLGEVDNLDLLEPQIAPPAIDLKINIQ